MFRKISDAYKFLGVFVLNVFLMLIIGHYLIGAVFLLKSYIEGVKPGIDSRAYLPPYDNYPEKELLWLGQGDAFKTNFEPYFHWRRPSLHTKYTNVDDAGIRKTIKHPNKNAKKVFVMGGSTTWSTGAPDDMTIPSILQRLLGPDYDVYNLGETAFVAAQELNYLLKKLADGDVPDIVIFYDGNNDGYAGAYSPGIPRDPLNLRQYEMIKQKGFVYNGIRYIFYKRLNYSILFDWISKKVEKSNDDKLWDQNIKGREKELVSQVVNYYEAHIRQVKALSREYGFQVYFFWQPHLLNLSRNVHPYEQEIINNSAPGRVESQRQVYLQAKERFSNREDEDIFFLGDVLNESKEPIFIDWSHISPRGNQIIAEKMFECLRDKIISH